MATRRSWKNLHEGLPPQANILIVDDDSSVRDSLARLVELAGWTVQVAATAETADLMLANGSFDVCLLDIELPGMGGPEFLKWAHARDGLLAIIMISGMNNPEVALETMQKGARTYLTKPVHAQFLIHAIKDALAVRNLMIERNNSWGA